MVIVNQEKTKTTKSLELDIKEMKTCKNIEVKKEDWEKFKRITQKENNYISFKELKGLSEFLGQDMMKSIYAIMEVKTNRIFGIYSTKEKTKEVLQTIIEKNEKQKSYTLPKDAYIGMML